MSDCKYCGEPIQWMIGSNGGWLPVDPDSVGDEEAKEFDPKAGHILHFETCTAKDQTEEEYQASLEQGES